MPRHRSQFSGLLVGLFSLGTALLLLAYEFTNLVWALRSWVMPLGGVLVLASAWLGARLASRAAQQARVETLFSARRQAKDPDEDGLFIELLVKVNYERDVAERLVAYEFQNAPQASRYELIWAAIQRWERDNRTMKGGGGLAKDD